MCVVHCVINLNNNTSDFLMNKVQVVVDMDQHNNMKKEKEWEVLGMVVLVAYPVLMH